VLSLSRRSSHAVCSTDEVWLSASSSASTMMTYPLLTVSLTVSAWRSRVHIAGFVSQQPIARSPPFLLLPAPCLKPRGLHKVQHSSHLTSFSQLRSEANGTGVERATFPAAQRPAIQEYRKALAVTSLGLFQQIVTQSIVAQRWRGERAVPLPPVRDPERSSQLASQLFNGHRALCVPQPAQSPTGFHPAR